MGFAVGGGRLDTQNQRFPHPEALLRNLKLNESSKTTLGKSTEMTDTPGPWPDRGMFRRSVDVATTHVAAI